MSHGQPISTISRLSARSLGTFRGRTAVEMGVTRKQLAMLLTADAIERVLPDTYRMTATPRSSAQSLRAALLWAGDSALAAVRSAGETYGLEGVRAARPEIVVVAPNRARSKEMIVHRARGRGTTPGTPRRARPRARGAIDPRGEDPSPPCRARLHRLPARARRRRRLRARQREVECPRPPRLPPRGRDLGQGHAPSEQAVVGARNGDRRVGRLRWGYHRSGPVRVSRCH